ncbi:MAG: hypothetical protein JNK79_11630 [Chitinophagaceae bacterium]|nr:hypothetical protein [Chitinophagaceae bacterium]
MYKKLNNLSFVIGAFFTIVSLILFANILITGRNDALSLYSASAFLIFGVVMMFTS